jgi:TonB-linked SusC/RagA family outer membrane protein
MKLKTIIVLSALFFASSISLQAKKVSLNFNNAQFGTVLMAIKQQTGYELVYSDQVIDENKTVSIKAENVEVKEALDNLLSKTDVSCRIVNNKIYFIKKNTSAPENRLQNSQMNENIVTGTIVDENGEPLIGVSVLVKGTHTGAITDVNGRYSITAPSNGTLVFKYVGYRDKIISVNNKKMLNVEMKSDIQSLDEVVAVGYGTVRKRDLTGSISSVGADKLKERSFGNALQAMAGQVSGVQITQTQGAPGMAPTVKVRGASSITSGTTPLYVIDGIPLEDDTDSGSGTNGGTMSYNRNPMNNINPNDIESIEVLKDASSAAIYGSRGANGVVIITTKQGKAGKTKIDVNYNYSISKVLRTVDVMDAKQWMDYETAARNNSWATTLKSNPNASRGNDLAIPTEFTDQTWLNRIGNGTDWQDVLYRTAQTHDVQFTASGGSEKTQFLTSMGYLNQEGVVDNSSYNRVSIRSNINHKFNDRFSMSLKIAATRSNDRSYGVGGKADAVSLALQSDPIFPVRVETGSLGFMDPSSIWHHFANYSFNLWHPYATTRETFKKKTTNNVLINSYLDYKIIDGLTFRTAFNVNVEDAHYKYYQNAGQDWGWSGNIPAQGSYSTFRTDNWVWENTLNYNKIFSKDHEVTGLLGYTMQEEHLENSTMSAQSFANDLVHTLNAGIVNSGSTNESEWALESIIARGTYSYKGKYLASATLRADGCSRFGKNNRWGYFPSASIAWRASEESFLANTRKWMDNLKFRLSYGVTGNNQISNYGAIGLLGYSTYVEDGAAAQGIYTSTYPDPDLKWEKTGQMNFGIDAAFLNSRLSLSLDLYYSRTKDMLLNVPVPVLTGFTERLTNVGEVENKGLEFSFSSKNIVGVFNWSTDFNISTNRNKVKKLSNNNAPILVYTNDAISKTEVGQPIGNYYGYEIDGVLSTADLTSIPVYPGSEAGDPKVRDVNGDKKITDADRTILGNYQPDFTWGMTNNFSYKGFELSFMLTGSEGGEIMNQQARYMGFMNGNRNLYASEVNYWKSDEDPGDGKTPKPRIYANTVQQQCTSDWVENGSFVRIKNIRLGYNFPRILINKLGITGLKFYLNCENVYVWSNYRNYDPECSTFQTGYRVGYDYGAYPVPFTATAGLTLNF